jgi:transposase
MSEKRRSYSRAFKQEAVNLVLEGGISVAQAARDLEVPESALWRWKKQYEDDPEQAFPGKGRLKPRDEELRQLRQELARARQERDILKKAVGIFSRMPK